MSKSNPTTRPDAPNYEVVDNMIHRFEPMTVQEAFGALSQVKDPLCGFRDADFQPWVKSRLHYVHPTAAEPFRTKSEKFQQCACIVAEDPRKVPEGVPELPEPWLAYVGLNSPLDQPDLWGCDEYNRWRLHAYSNNSHYAIDVRTAFAREHFPEYVEALGYPLEEAFPWAIGDKVKAIGTDTIGEVTVVVGGTAIVRFSDGSCASFSHGMLESAEDRIQLTDTQLLDKLDETELRMADGRQFWQVFTDRDDPKMTVREAIEAWGADE